MPSDEQAKEVESTSAPRKLFGVELTFRSNSKPKTKKPMIEVGLQPSANFLPPLVREGKTFSFVRRRLFAASIATISVSFLAYLASTIISFSGDIILQNAELRLATVKAEQAKYSPIRDLENSIRFQESARYVATSTQVSFRQLVSILTQQLPSGASYQSIQISPFDDGDLSSSGLSKPFSVKAAIAMELRNYPSLQTYLDRLPRLEAFYDYRLESVSATDTGIAVNLILYLNLELYSRPFEEPLVLGDPIPISILDTEPIGLNGRAQEAGSGSDETAPTPSPSPTPTPSPSKSPTPSPSPSEEVTG